MIDMSNYTRFYDIKTYERNGKRIKEAQIFSAERISDFKMVYIVKFLKIGINNNTLFRKVYEYNTLEEAKTASKIFVTYNHDTFTVF